MIFFLNCLMNFSWWFFFFNFFSGFFFFEFLLIFFSRGSCLTRTYTTTFALYIVGVLRKYHTIFLLNLPDVVTAFEQLNKIAYRPKFPLESGKTMLDCNSAEWCILNYLYDLASNCSTLKTSERYLELKRHFPSVSFYPFCPFCPFLSILSIFVYFVHFCPFCQIVQFLLARIDCNFQSCLFTGETSGIHRRGFSNAQQGRFRLLWWECWWSPILWRVVGRCEQRIVWNA